MRNYRIPAILVALAAVASVADLRAQQPTTPRINQRESATTTTRPEANQNSQTGGVSVKQAIVQKLRKANEAEIEIAQLAMQRAENQEVQQLAKMLVDDHQAALQKLNQINDAGASGNRQGTNTTSDNATTTRSASPNKAQSTTPSANAGTTKPASNDARSNNRIDAAAATAQQSADRQADATGNINERRQGNRSRGENAMVPQQLVQIMDQACDNSLKLTKEMLENHQGQDFAMAFLGQQCVQHTMMLAELQAIQSQGPEELQSLAQESIGKVETHLEKIKQLAKKLEDDRSTTRAAARK